MTFEKTEENFRLYKGREIVRTNPFGFWKVQGLNESFTQLNMAVQAVDALKIEKIERPEKKKKVV